jgi:hypothetical protein
MNDGLERIWKEVWLPSEVPSRDFSGQTEESHEETSVRIWGVPAEIRKETPPQIEPRPLPLEQPFQCSPLIVTF